MLVAKNALVLVTDGRKRLFFRNEGDAEAPQLKVVLAAEDDNPRTQDQVTDAAGRASSALSGGGSLPSADAHDIEESRFAARTAEQLTRGALANDYEALILVAPPETLGRIRKDIHKGVEKRTIREVAKDMTSHPVADIEKMLVSLD